MSPPTSTYVDDTAHEVQYQGGWDWQPSVSGEFHNTRHGLSEPGKTASLSFTGTGIEVFGTVEETAESGTPTSQYSINETIIDIFEAPFVATGDILHNVRYFSKRDLPRGNYEIKVTKLDSLTSNELWLDYFLVWDEASPPAIPSAIPPISQPESSSNLPTAPSRHSTPSSTSSVRSSTHTLSPISSSMSPPDKTSTSSSSSTARSATRETPSSDTHLHSTSPPISQSPASSYSSLQATEATVTLTELLFSAASPSPSTIPPDAPSSSNNLRTIVGGAVGSLALLVPLAMLFVCVRRRRMARENRGARPYVHTPQSLSQQHLSDSGSSPEMVSEPSTLSLPSSTACSVYSARAAASDMTTSPHPSSKGSHARAPVSSCMNSTTQPGHTDPSDALASIDQPSAQSTTSTDRLITHSTASTPLPSPATSALPFPASFAHMHGADVPDAHAEVSRVPWYVPAGLQARAQALLHSISAREGREERSHTPLRDVDSGMRMYNQDTLPPAYTAE